MSKERISGLQLAFLLIAFIFGDTAILSPAVGSYQDNWLGFIIGWGCSFFLLWIYISIKNFYPAESWIEILKSCYGPYLGSAIALFYIGYFLHVGALVIREFAEYMIVVNFPETPIIFFSGLVALLGICAVRYGIEVIGRLYEILGVIFPFITIMITLFVLPRFEVRNFLPILENGLKPVLKTAFSTFSFPFGELIVFLMIFNHLHTQKKLAKVVYLSSLFGGLLILLIITRDLMVLGPDMFENATFPAQLSSELIPNNFITMTPFVAVNLLIGSGAKTIVYLYAASLGSAQLFNLRNYKSLVIPLAAFMVALSIWVYDSLFQLFRWTEEIWPYYAVIPFQLGIPLVTLLVLKIKTIIKGKRKV
ncbi:endospore germination permease [Bacillota bacterium LX-D]|nr:endospore germination permease [Bacillota bacterium LX-D]